MSLKKQAISGVKWNIVSKVSLSFTDLLKISVLARFLDKSDFGLMALVTFVLGFMNLFMDIGLTSAIFHRQNISREEYASLYWINVVFSLIIYLIIYLVTPFIASFYNEPELNVLIPLMAVSIILSAIGRQFKTIEQKNLNFKFVAINDVIGSVTGLAVGVSLAVLGYGVFSLIYGSLAKYLVSNLIFFIKGIRDQGLVFHFNYNETKPFLSIGLYNAGSQVVNYFNRDIDILLIGKFFGTDILGGYSLAKQLVKRPINIINSIVSSVAFSIFPKRQNDHAALRKYFIDLFNGMGVLGAFIYGVIFIFAHQITLILYGSGFLSIVIYIQLFTVLIFLRGLATNVGILIITTGRTDYGFYWNVFVTLAMPLVVIIGVNYSVELVIILLGFLQFLLLFPGWAFFYKKLINMEFIPYLKSNLLHFLIAVIICIVSQVVFRNNLAWQIFSAFLLLTALGIYGYKTLDELKLLITKVRKRIQI